MPDRLRKTWRALRAWCARNWAWLAGLAVSLLVGVGFARRKPKVPRSTPEGRAHLAEAIRPGLEAAAARKRKEAEEHKAFAEEKIREADADLERVRNLPADELLKESNELLDKLRRGGVILALLAALGSPSTVRASEPASTEETKASAVVKITDPGGAVFYLVPDDFYRWLYGTALGAAKVKLEAIPAFREAYEDQGDADATCQGQVLLERGIGDAAKAELAVTKDRLALANKWFRAPKFLVPLGVVLGGALVAGVAAAVSQ